MTVRLRDLPYLLYATGICIVAAFMFFMQLLSMSDSCLGFPVPLLMCFLFPLFQFLGTACHEAGHAAAALLARLSILQIAFGTMVFVRHEKGFVSRGRDSSMEGLGGYVTAIPKSSGNLGWRHFLVTSGGPAASLVVGLACLVPAMLINRTQPYTTMLEIGWPLTEYWIPRTWPAAFLMMAALTNLDGFLLSVIPSRLSGWSNDAALLLEWKRHPQQSEQAWILQALGNSMVEGKRPRDWDPAMIERALELRDDCPSDMSANLYGYYYAMDCGAVERAGRLLDLALLQFEGCPPDWRAALLLEAAYLEGFIRRNAEAARKRLGESAENEVTVQTRLRGEAAVLFAEQRFAEAHDAIRKALLVLADSGNHGISKAEHDWLHGLLLVILEAREGTCNRVERLG